MQDIRTFKRHAKYKMIVMYLAILLPILILSILESVFDNLKVNSMIYRYTAFALVEGWIIYKIVIYHLILAKEGFAEQLLTKINDERNLFIKMKALNLCCKTIMFINGIALIVVAFMNVIVFYVIFCELVAFIVTYIFMRLYFSKKF